ALGHLLWDGDETEVALLVEDDWQRRGIGSEQLLMPATGPDPGIRPCPELADRSPFHLNTEECGYSWPR
ncbi:hypothetical protein ABZV15_32510, partial [Streptomyces sp. NPDC005246]|uniref:hypothetical protein n=1 Tax=Streptomyces sp. NPDC005246 TaxID=3156716 RepID=UPI0033BC02F9